MTLHPSIFREYDIRGVYPSTLSEADVLAIGRAFGARVKQAKGGAGSVCVGYDGRLSSPPLKAALIDGLLESGHRVLDTGLGPTPQLYYAVFALHADGGIMVTGSHNPPDQNGLKFMLGKKPFYGDAIRTLRDEALALKPQPKTGSVEQHPITEEYVGALVQALPSGLREAAGRLHIAWDAGNGAAGQVMAALCKKLPGRHLVLNEAIDGTFPAHHPDPSEAKNLQQLIAEVRKNKCSAGIAFDGDGDRIGVVDDEGEILWGDQLLMLYARDVLAGKPGSTIIADVKASQALFDEVARLGGQPLMWKTGHSHIKSKMLETGAPLAGEMSGHMFFADRYFGFDDALYAAVRLLGVLSGPQSLSAMRKGLEKRPSTPEIRFPCEETRKFAVIEEVRGRLAARGASMIDVDGIRLNTPEGWWLLRASNTQAMLVARAEARDEKGLGQLKEDLRNQLALSKVALP